MLYAYTIKIYYTHVIRDLRDMWVHYTIHYEFVDYSFLVESYNIHNIICKLESINIKQLEFTFFTMKNK